MLSRVRPAGPSAAARQAPLSLGLSGQESWGGPPAPSSRRRPSSGSKFLCLAPPTWAGGFFTTSTTWEPIAYRGKVILMTVDLSSETTEARMKAAKIISSVERKELSTQDPTFRLKKKMSFRNKREMKTFSDERQLRLSCWLT